MYWAVCLFLASLWDQVNWCDGQLQMPVSFFAVAGSCFQEKKSSKIPLYTACSAPSSRQTYCAISETFSSWRARQFPQEWLETKNIANREKIGLTIGHQQNSKWMLMVLHNGLICIKATFWYQVAPINFKGDDMSKLWSQLVSAPPSGPSFAVCPRLLALVCPCRWPFGWFSMLNLVAEPICERKQSNCLFLYGYSWCFASGWLYCQYPSTRRLYFILFNFIAALNKG